MLTRAHLMMFIQQEMSEFVRECSPLGSALHPKCVFQFECCFLNRKMKDIFHYIVESCYDQADEINISSCTHLIPPRGSLQPILLYSRPSAQIHCSPVDKLISSFIFLSLSAHSIPLNETAECPPPKAEQYEFE